MFLAVSFFQIILQPEARPRLTNGTAQVGLSSPRAAKVLRHFFFLTEIMATAT